MSMPSICCYPVLVDNGGSSKNNAELRGPLDILGRNFRAYLSEHPDQEELFMRAWGSGDVVAALQIVQSFFEGLPDLKEVRPSPWSYYDDRPLRAWGVVISPTAREVYVPLAARSASDAPPLRWHH